MELLKVWLVVSGAVCSALLSFLGFSLPGDFVVLVSLSVYYLPTHYQYTVLKYVMMGISVSSALFSFAAQKRLYNVLILLVFFWFVYYKNLTSEAKNKLQEDYFEAVKENQLFKQKIEVLEKKLGQKTGAHSGVNVKNLMLKLKQYQLQNKNKQLKSQRKMTSMSDNESELSIEIISSDHPFKSKSDENTNQEVDDIQLSKEEIEALIKAIKHHEDVFWSANSIKAEFKNITNEEKSVYTQANNITPTVVRTSEKLKKRPPIMRKKLASFDEAEELAETLDNIGEWDFDTILLRKQTQFPAYETGYFVFNSLSITDNFKISNDKLNNFLHKVESSYNESNFYHNSLHASDVLGSSVFLMNKGLQSCGNLQDIDVFSLVTAALCHDIGHPGVNNAFLVASQDKLAMKYNDHSILENMHCNKTFEILSEESCNIIESLEEAEYRKFRKLVIAAILATDLQVHFTKVAEFKERLQKEYSLEDEKFCTLAVQVLLKCADIAHGAKTLRLHKAWTKKIVNEFFKQGDFEREKGLPVSPLCDRRNVVVSTSQLGFLKVLVLPLYEAWQEFVEQNEDEESSSAMKLTLENIYENIDFWEQESISPSMDINEI